MPSFDQQGTSATSQGARARLVPRVASMTRPESPAPPAREPNSARGRESGDRGVPLFVYGTLMRNLENHHYLAPPECRFVREVATGPGFALLDLGPFPGMIKAGRGSVQGELFQVPRSRLPLLDHLEGHPQFYWRTRIDLADRTSAVSYLLVDEESLSRPRVESGDWREHLAHRRASARHRVGTPTAEEDSDPM